MRARSQAVFLMLARNQEARERAFRTVRQVPSGWSVRIGGPVKGHIHRFFRLPDVVKAVDAHYDDRLRRALHSPGWRPHLQQLVISALHNGKKVSLRSVIATAWRRRRWPHTGRHTYRTVEGRRQCQLCASSLRLRRFTP